MISQGELVAPLAPMEQQLGEGRGYRVILLSSLLPLMRQADIKAAAKQRATALLEQAHQGLIALDYELAVSKLTAAQELLEQSFLRWYDSRILAQVCVLRGVAALDRGRPDLAREHFVSAHHLDPSFDLGAYYSPQVRAAFAEARRSLPPPPVPSVSELRDLMELASAAGAVVVGLERAGEQDLLKVALYLHARQAYTAAESRLVRHGQQQALSRGAQALARQLDQLLSAQFPPPPPPLVELIKKGDDDPPPPPPPRPWYKRWYTWVALGAVVSAVVAIPLAVADDHVRLEARW